MKKQKEIVDKSQTSNLSERLNSAVTGINNRIVEEDKKVILHRRAKDLSKPLISETKGTSFEYVQFALANELYGIEKECIKEVFTIKDLTVLPCVPAFIIGIINYRGRILSVIDMKKFYDLPDAGITEMNYIIILQNKDLEFGILADRIIGVAKAYMDELQKTLPTLKGIREEFLKGITPERVIILDQNKILNDERLIINEQV